MAAFRVGAAIGRSRIEGQNRGGEFLQLRVSRVFKGTASGVGLLGKANVEFGGRLCMGISAVSRGYGIGVRQIGLDIDNRRAVHQVVPADVHLDASVLVDNFFKSDSRLPNGVRSKAGAGGKYSQTPVAS